MTITQNEREVLANFIMKICSKERYIEVRRQLLCDKNDFEPYVAFNRLSRANDSNGITGRNIVEFLRESMIDATDKKTKSLLTHYDSDTDDVLSYKEFLDIVLPKEHPDLRAFVTQRECFDITNDEYLGYETEAALALLLEREIGIFEDMMEDKEKLDTLGINGLKIVEIIDGDVHGNLNFNNIRSFVLESGIIPYDSEVIAFLRRVDRDDDGVINAEEMDKFLNLFSFCEDSRFGRKRRSTLKSNDIMTKSPRRKIVSNKLSLLSSKKKNSNRCRDSDLNESKKLYPNVFKTESTGIGRGEVSQIRQSFRRTSVATNTQQKIENREISRLENRYPGSELRGSETERKKSGENKKIFSSTQARVPIPNSKPSFQQQRKNSQEIGNKTIAYDPRRESFGVHVEPNEKLNNSIGFELSRETFSLRRNTLNDSNLTKGTVFEEEIEIKDDLQYSPRRQSFGLGNVNSTSDNIPLIYDKEKASTKESNTIHNFRKRESFSKNKEPLSQITPNRIKERNILGEIKSRNEPLPLYKTPVHSKRKPPERVVVQINNTPNTYITKTEIRPLSPNKGKNQEYNQENYRESNENLEPNTMIPKITLPPKIEESVTPRQYPLQNNTDLTISPVIERTSGYQFTSKGLKKRPEITMTPSKPMKGTTTPLKSVLRNSVKKRRSMLKSALKTSPKKYEKPLSVRWADEEKDELLNNENDADVHEYSQSSITVDMNKEEKEDNSQNNSKVNLSTHLIDNEKITEKTGSLEYDSKCDQHLYFSSLTQNVEISKPVLITKIKEEGGDFNFIEALKQILEEESKLDRAKRDLFANPDFNIKKLMNMIDINNNGCIKFEDLSLFFETIGIVNADQDVIIDFFEAYDTDQTYSLGFQSLAKMVYPFERRIVREGQYNSKEFYRLTLRDILTLFQQHLKTREVILEVKQKLSKNNIDISSLFESLDVKNKGFLEKKDFIDLFEKRGKENMNSLHPEEIDLFVSRCDLDGDGKVDYRDFYLFFSL